MTAETLFDLAEFEREAVVAAAHRRYAPDLDEGVLARALDAAVRFDLPARHDGTRADLAALKDMTSTLIGRFAAAPEDATRAQYGPGPLTRYTARLVVPDAVRAEVAVLKGIAAHFVMFTARREAELMRQREVLEHLVAHFRARPDALDAVFAADLAQADGEADALRVVVDQVASLTDGRAWALAQAS